MDGRVFAYDDAAAIQNTIARLAATRLGCCFTKSGLATALTDNIRCWCYQRGENGEDVTLTCVARKLVIHEGAIGDARFGFEE
jgi:hypothetical protein